MDTILIQLLLIPFFILLNGFFAGAELALLSAKRQALLEKKRQGSKNARAALSFKDAPERFLPTVQVGITIVGSVASTIGGATLVTAFEEMAAPHMGAQAARFLGIVLVVGAISFFMLVIGELAPKNIALKHPEQYSLVLGRPMALLEKAVYPLVRLLDLATAFVLAPFGGKATSLSHVSREELRHVLLEGHQQGLYTSMERAIITGAIDLVNRTVKEGTTPRHELAMAPPTVTLGELRTLIVKASAPYTVLYDESSDQVHGLLGWEDLFKGDPEDPAIRHSRRLVYVPESAPLPKAMEQLQKSGLQAGLVVNEYGEFEGLLALSTIWQRQLLTFGESDSGYPGIEPIEGGWLIRGDIALTALRERLALPIEDNIFYTTMGGFVLEALGRLPQPGDHFSLYGYSFTVRSMEGRRVHEVDVRRVA